jgi:serine/threonine-protein kinase RsbW
VHERPLFHAVQLLDEEPGTGALMQVQFLSDHKDLGWQQTLESEIAPLVRSAGLDELSEMGIRVALVEAVNNVIEHGYANSNGKPLKLRGRKDHLCLTFELRDQGRPIPLPLPDGHPVDPMAGCGRGWQIIRAAFPEVFYDRHNGENRLTLIRPLYDPRSAR